MLSPGKKICALRDKKNKYSKSWVIRKKKFERNKKNIPPPPPPPPPFKLNGRSLRNKKNDYLLQLYCAI